MGVLIQLPVAQLQDALIICSELRSPLLEYAKEMNKHQISHVSQQVLDLLHGKSIDTSDGGERESSENIDGASESSSGKPPGVD